jgi:hypothetical protein
VNDKLNGVLKMNRFTKALAASALALGISAVAAPSMASTLIFADFDTGASNARNFVFTNTGGDDATFSTTVSANGGAGAAGVFFSFLGDPSLSSFFDMPALLTLSGTVTDTAAQFDGVTYTQQGLNGSFDFVFNGATGTYNGFNLVHGVTSLFSGTFTNAWIQGSTGVGGIDVTIGNGGSATYTSAYYDLSKFDPGTFEYTLHLGGVNPTFGQADASSALNSFRAHVGGEFQGMVPEPATWALMIMGFGGAGAMLRSQRRRALVRA